LFLSGGCRALLGIAPLHECAQFHFHSNDEETIQTVMQIVLIGPPALESNVLQ